MTISVFTPIHKPDFQFLEELFRSLEAQTRQPDEWIIMCNGAMIDETIPFEKAVPWVRVFHSPDTGNIGALKGYCCQIASGDILVEVDYDDTLTPDALERIESVFQNHQVQFVYSNCAEMRADHTYNTYSAEYGWKSRPFQDVEQIVAFPTQAHYMRRVEWAPNHVRAFRKSAYDAIGGYNRTIQVGDDHDLICRFYIAYGEKGFFHIDDCLYIYRLHAGNTCNGQNRNGEIQRQVDANYVRHAEQMYLRWAIDNRLGCVDLGGRLNSPDRYVSVDLQDADIIADLNTVWPFEDGSIGVIRAYHVLEHLDDPIHFFNEAYRVLAPGGFLLIEVPSANGAGAFGDPTHKKFFNLLTFEYFTNQQYARFIQPQYTGRFQKARVVEYWWQNPKIPVISAQLIAIKGWYDERWCGEKNI